MSVGAAYVIFGCLDSVYCRMVASDEDASGDISLTEYDAIASSGIHRLFGPIHTIMKGIYAAIWPFEVADEENQE